MNNLVIKKTKFWKTVTILLWLFLVCLIPIYYHYYGLQNFLWLSDIGLFLTCLALGFNSPLLMSMAAVGVMVLELVWCVGFFSELIFNVNLITLSDYMFNPVYPLALRAISLFHIVTPVIWFSYLWQFGYKKAALNYFVLLYWLVLLLTYCLTNPNENINWVFMPKIMSAHLYASYIWAFFLILGFPVLIFWPTDLVYRKIFKTN